MSTIQIMGVISIFISVSFTVYNALAASVGGGQSVSESLAEAWTNIAIGFSTNFIANIFILPLIGTPLTVENNFWIGCIYTAISFFRTFFVRRYYNWRTARRLGI